MKSVPIRLVITVLYITLLLVAVLAKPEEKFKIHEEHITQSVASNFAGAYKDVDSFNIKKDKEEQRKKLIVSKKYKN